MCLPHRPQVVSSMFKSIAESWPSVAALIPRRSNQIRHRRLGATPGPSGGDVNKDGEGRLRESRREQLTEGHPARYQGGIHADLLHLCS
jgi:hypothetical protein